MVTAIAAALLFTSLTPGLMGSQASSSNATHNLGFWLQEADVMRQYSPQAFFNGYFLTPPYPSSVEMMIFAPLQDETNGYGCSTSSNYVKQSISYWGQVAQMADSYPNIKLIYEIAFDPASSTYGLSCFNTMVQAFSGYPSIYALGVEGEFTGSISVSQMQTAMNDVTATGKEFIDYYSPVAIPSGGYDIAHTNFPMQGDQVGTLSKADSQTVGISSGYYDNFLFPSTFSCPIGPSDVASGALTNEPQGYNQCVVSTELSTAVSQPAGTRQFLELAPGFSSSGSFTGASGQSTNQLWDNPTLRNWIWNDPNYQPYFILSTSSASGSTSSTSTTSTSSVISSSSTTVRSSSSSTTRSSSSTTSSSTRASSNTTVTSTSTTQSSSNSSSTTTSPTSSQTVVITTATQAEPQSYALTVVGGCPSTGSGSYPPGTTATVQIVTICNREGGSGLRVTSWSLDGGANNTILTNSTYAVPILMNSPHTVTLHTVTQYSLTLDYGAQSALLSLTSPRIPGDNYWYDSGTPITYIGRTGLPTSLVVGWEADGNAPVPVSGGVDFVSDLVMNGPHTLIVIAEPSNSTCASSGCDDSKTVDVSIQTNTNLPSGMWIDGAYYPKAVTFAWTVGSLHNITVAQGFKESAVRSTFGQWTGLLSSRSTTILLNANKSGSLTAEYSKQYLVQLAFIDESGEPLTPQFVTLVGPSGDQALGSNLSAWVEPGAPYSLKSVIWMDWNVALSNDSSFSITQSTTLTFSTDVYSQTIKVTDAYGMPVQGATIDVTTVNNRTISIGTGSQGTAQFRIPVGLFSATVSYLGVNDQIIASSQGSHNYNVNFLLSYPLVATIGAAVGASALSVAYFRFRKKPEAGPYIFSDS